MIYKLEDIDNKLKELIIKTYDTTHDIKKIEESYKIARNTLLALLAKNDYYYTKEEASSFEIIGNKLLIISDTHIGSKKENLFYIDKAYETGIINNVSACLHLGDILQGEYDHSNKPISYQLEILDKTYPEVSNFDTYLLLGNHDYSIFENNIDAKNILLSKKTVNTLGYKKTYFNWNNYLYVMEHKVKQIKEELPLEDYALSFIGHGHELKVKSQSKLKVPTLSDDIINQTNGAFPAFLIANLCDNYLDVDVYAFKKGEVKLRKKRYFEKELIDVYKVK